VRFRSGDGFSNARALGLQLCLAAVPLLIALNGLASRLGGLRRAGRVVADTVLALTPGASESLVRQLLLPPAFAGASERTLGALLLRRLRVERRAGGSRSSAMASSCQGLLEKVGAANGCGFGKGQDSVCLVLRSSNAVHMRCSDRCRSEHSGRL
jgi:hypothetical protein